MRVLHIVWAAQTGFHLWGEDGTCSVEQRDPEDSEAESQGHPFALDSPDLRQLLAEMLPGWMVRDDTGQLLADSKLILSLPSNASRPQASERLIWTDEPDTTRTFDALESWTVPTLSMSGIVTSEFVRKTNAPDGVELGSTIEFMRPLEQMAQNFVQAGRVLPRILETDDGFEARWQPVPSTDADLKKLSAFRETMPPVMRAVEAPEGRQSSRRILEAGLESLVDALVRERLSEYPGRFEIDSSHRARKEWLRALSSFEPQMEASERSIRSLRDRLSQWTESVRRESRRRARLCLRLRPPETENVDEDDSHELSVADGPWRLEFWLQSVDDPAVRVNAETIWESTGKARQTLEAHLEDPQQTLLQELGRAVRLYPKLEKVLEDRQPANLKLDSHEAYQFLSEYVPVLEEAGVSTLIPAWWEKPDKQLGARLSVGDSSGEGLGVDEMCAFEWELVLGDDALDRQDLERLADLKMPLVRMHGEWVTLDPEDIERAIQLFDEQPEDKKSVGEAVRIGLGIDESPKGLSVVGHEFEGRLREVFASDLKHRVGRTEAPTNFDGTLRPYQRQGLAWIRFLEKRGFGGCLADDMGLGKTIQVLARLAEERVDVSGENNSPGATLVVAPLSVVGNWQKEAMRFVPSLNVHVHHGTDRLEGAELTDTIEKVDLIITTYGVVRNDVETLAERSWWRIVLDEAQKIKNSEARRSQAVRSLVAERRLALTGTPVENRLSELWSIMDFLNPDLLGPEKRFRKQIGRPVERGDERKTEKLRRLTGPFILRRHKTDDRIAAELPEKVEIKEYCSLTREQATLYKAVIDDVMEKIEESSGMERRGTVFSLMTRLKQVCNHPEHFLDESDKLDNRSGKLNRLEELATQIIAEDEKAIVFTQYTEMAQLIRRHLQEKLGRRVLYLHGGTPKGKRDEMVQRFQDPDGPPVFLLSLRAGGTGLTLTEASHVIHYDRWWNPAVENQATDRVFRIGQTDNVQVRKLICEGTFEEQIDRMIDRKKALAERVLSGGKDWVTEMSNDELRELIEFSGEALA